MLLQWMKASARRTVYATATNILRDRWRKLKREREWAEQTQGTESVHQEFNLPIDMSAVFDQLESAGTCRALAGTHGRGGYLATERSVLF